MTLQLAIDDREIAASMEPFISRRFHDGDPEWARIVEANKTFLRRKRFKRALVDWLPWRHRTQRSVEFNYSRQWAAQPAELDLAGGGPPVPFVWRDERFEARAALSKRVRLLFLMRALAQLKPLTVLEVGAGNGVNLCLLAGRFPEIKITGVELTAGGVAAAERLLGMEEIPRAISSYSPEPLRDSRPFDRIRIVRGNAGALPFPDASFDLVITVLALEQMEEIRDRALAEIRRVARGFTAMVEPFYEWNATGSERDYIIANDYFAGRIADLPRFGLEPIVSTADMPSKLTFRTGLVVSRVMSHPQ